MITTCSSSPISSFVSTSNPKPQFSCIKSPQESPNHVKVRSISRRTRYSSDKPEKFNGESSSCAGRFCSCGRRRFIETVSTALIPVYSSKASDLHSDYAAMMNKFHPQRPDWYEEFFASAMESCMKPYEVEVAGYKSQLFTNLKGKAKNVLEIGIGTGPNLKYYVGDTGVHVIGVDPNRKMEKYAKAAAVAAGLPLTNFNFMQAVGEALPLSDASVDAVVGTLVLCSVKDVNMTLKEVMRVLKPGGLYLFVEHVAAGDGTVIRILQNILDPLEQAVADGCHLTRETGNNIVEAGFSNVDIQTKFFSTLPYVYGIACK